MEKHILDEIEELKAIFEREYWKPLREMVDFEESISYSSLGEVLGSSSGYVKMAMEKTAKEFNIERVFYCTQGTTTSNHILLTYQRRRWLERKILVSANLHKSIIDPCIDFGIPIRFAPIEWYNEFECVIPPHPKCIKELLIKYNPSMVIIISPTYEGIYANIDAIYDEIKKYDSSILLYVDNAWGSGLNSPICDIFSRSTHKMDGSLNGGSIIGIKSSKYVDIDLFEECATARLTTSPSYLIVGSIERTYDIWSTYGDRLDKIFNEWVREFKKELENHGIGEVLTMRHLKNYYQQIDGIDLRKVHVKLDGISGIELSNRLQHLKNESILIPEKAGFHTITFLITCRCLSHDPRSIVKKISSCVQKIHAEKKGRIIDIEAEYPLSLNIYDQLRKMEVFEAFNGGTDVIPTSDAIHRVIASPLSPYPPGVPILIPGMEIENKTVQELRKLITNGGKIIGGYEDLQRIRVVKE